MKTILFVIALLVVSIGVSGGQTGRHRWHVVDAGGGRSTHGGITGRSSIGQPAVGARRTGGKGFEAGYLPGVRSLVRKVPLYRYNASGGWNMVSVPVRVSDFRKTSLYPTASSVAFAYTGSYQQRDTLRFLTGYWVKFPAVKSIVFNGTAVANDTADVNNAWNMIGCLSNPVRTADIVPIGTTILSKYFGYNGQSGYFTEDTLKPGSAYWVKAGGAGRLAMTSGSGPRAPSMASSVAVTAHIDGGKHPDALKDMSTLTFGDENRHERILYFSAAVAALDASKYELPPVAPSFDVRYASNRMAEAAEQGKLKEVAIRISSAEYPLTVSWSGGGDASLLIDKKEISLKEPGTAHITGPETSIKLRLASGGPALPKEFALLQNYPNPFNPVTNIRYDLPSRAQVRLELYNALGQEVATLVDEEKAPGRYSVEWNAGAVPSGVYFYRMTARQTGVGEAGGFVYSRKLLVVK